MMKSTLALLALAGSASAFTTAPSAKTVSTTALNDVWDDFDGGINFAAKPLKFDPVSSVNGSVVRSRYLGINVGHWNAFFSRSFVS